MEQPSDWRGRRALIARSLALFISTVGIVMHTLADNVVETGFMVNHKFAYFTIQTNLMVALLFAVLVGKTLAQRRRTGRLVVARVHPSVHLALVLYITVTMLVFWLVLVPISGVPIHPFLFWNNLILHTVTPLLAIGDYVVFGAHGGLPKREALKWLLYPVAYLGFVMVFSQLIREPYYSIRQGDVQIALLYPYPFLDPQIVGVGGVVGAVVCFAGFFVLLGLVYIWIDNRLAERRAR